MDPLDKLLRDLKTHYSGIVSRHARELFVRPEFNTGLTDGDGLDAHDIALLSTPDRGDVLLTDLHSFQGGRHVHIAELRADNPQAKEFDSFIDEMKIRLGLSRIRPTNNMGRPVVNSLDQLLSCTCLSEANHDWTITSICPEKLTPAQVRGLITLNLHPDLEGRRPLLAVFNEKLEELKQVERRKKDDIKIKELRTLITSFKVVRDEVPPDVRLLEQGAQNNNNALQDLGDVWRHSFLSGFNPFNGSVARMESACRWMPLDGPTTKNKLIEDTVLKLLCPNLYDAAGNKKVMLTDEMVPHKFCMRCGCITGVKAFFKLRDIKGAEGEANDTLVRVNRKYDQGGEARVDQELVNIDPNHHWHLVPVDDGTLRPANTSNYCGKRSGTIIKTFLTKTFIETLYENGIIFDIQTKNPLLRKIIIEELTRISGGGSTDVFRNLIDYIDDNLYRSTDKARTAHRLNHNDTLRVADFYKPSPHLLPRLGWNEESYPEFSIPYPQRKATIENAVRYFTENKAKHDAMFGAGNNSHLFTNAASLERSHEIARRIDEIILEEKVNREKITATLAMLKQHTQLSEETYLRQAGPISDERRGRIIASILRRIDLATEKAGKVDIDSRNANTIMHATRTLGDNRAYRMGNVELGKLRSVARGDKVIWFKDHPMISIVSDDSADDVYEAIISGGGDVTLADKFAGNTAKRVAIAAAAAIALGSTNVPLIRENGFMYYADLIGKRALFRNQGLANIFLRYSEKLRRPLEAGEGLYAKQGQLEDLKQCILETYRKGQSIVLRDPHRSSTLLYDSLDAETLLCQTDPSIIKFLQVNTSSELRELLKYNTLILLFRRLLRTEAVVRPPVRAGIMAAVSIITQEGTIGNVAAPDGGAYVAESAVNPAEEYENRAMNAAGLRGGSYKKKKTLRRKQIKKKTMKMRKY